MVTRIRYNKLENILSSKSELMAGAKGLVNVIIDLYTLDFIITRLDNGQRLGSGKARTLGGAKKKVKQMLINLGVNFLEETRNRTTTTKTQNSTSINLGV